MKWFDMPEIKAIQERIETLESVKEWLEWDCETDTKGFEIGAVGKIQKAIDDLQEACEIMANIGDK